MVTTALAVVTATPVGIPDYATVTPSFVLMSVFHWTLYRPEYLGYFAIFLIGLFLDLLTTAPGTAVGLTSLVLLIARWTVFTNRKFFLGRDFAFIWLWFAALTGGAYLCIWIIGSVINGILLQPHTVAFQAVLTVALFPPIAWFLARLQRWVEAPGWTP